MENMPSHKSRISTPINAAAIAAQPMGLIFSLYRLDATIAVRIGVTAMMILEVAEVSVRIPVLKVII